jgi:transposase
VIRLHTRYRRDLTEERTREKNRAEKLLESVAIKLSSVVTDLHGVTGRDIMDHLIAGERNPKVLAQLARARARRKISELQAALEGAEFFTPAHATLPKAMLERMDALNTGIGELTEVIEALLAPYEEQLQQAESMPGWGRRSAEDALAETGVDMSRFPTGGHLASWAGRTPLDNQSGKRKGKVKAKKGNRYLGAVTGETAVAAGKTKTREGARYRRLARRRGKPKPASRSGRPRCASTTSCCPTPACATPTSAPTTTTTRPTPAGRSPTTSAGSAPSASKSLSAASPNPHQRSQAAPRPPEPYRSHRRATSRLRRRCRAPS